MPARFKPDRRRGNSRDDDQQSLQKTSRLCQKIEKFIEEQKTQIETFEER